jgi:hypothetical protein
MSLENGQSNSGSPEGNESRTNQNDSGSNINIPPLPIEENPLPPNPENDKPYAERSLALQHKGLWTEFATLVAVIVYATIAWCQWRTMNKTYGEIQKQTAAAQCAAKAAAETLGQIQQQTTLMRQQWVGAQAAVVKVGYPAWDFATGRFNMAMQNSGLIEANHVFLKAQVSLKSIPRYSIIGKPVLFEVSNMPIKAQWGIDNTKSVSWILPKVSANSWPGSVVTVAEGDFSYENGFGDKIPKQHFCYFWLPEFKNPIGGSEAGFMPLGGASCDIDSTIQAMKKQTENSKTP